MKQSSIEPRFVEFIPTNLEDGVLYVSQQYKTAIHKCCCGCGQEVVTPLSSAQWQVSVTAGKASLFPSIGNWNFECKSHYWIKKNQVVWSYAFTENEIQHVQARDRRDLQDMAQHTNLLKGLNSRQASTKERYIGGKPYSFLQRLWKWIIS